MVCIATSNVGGLITGISGNLCGGMSITQENRPTTMSERAEKAVQNYFRNIPGSNLAIGERYWFTKGYEQAEKDVIERIVRYLEDTNNIGKKELMKWIEENWQNELGNNPGGIYVRRCY